MMAVVVIAACGLRSADWADAVAASGLAMMAVVVIADCGLRIADSEVGVPLVEWVWPLLPLPLAGECRWMEGLATVAGPMVTVAAGFFWPSRFWTESLRDCSPSGRWARSRRSR